MIGNNTTINDQALLNKARDDKFLLVFDVPPLLRPICKRFNRKNESISIDTMTFSVYGTLVPSINVPSIDLKYSGSPFNISSHVHPKYENLKVKFTIDNMFNNYWVIYSWLNALRDADTGIYAQKADINNAFSGNAMLKDYSTDMTICAKDEYNNDIIKWIYKGAFPVTLAPIEFNYRSSSEIESSFEFAFSELYCVLI
jgi:hypothetical protein